MSAQRTLYYANGSIPNWRVLLALHEKQIAFVPRRLRLMGGRRETRSPEFLGINPRGKTPVLVEADGTVINESFAVLHWLELRYPEFPLLPGDAAGLARALSRAHEAESFACAYEPLEVLFEVKPGAVTGPQREALAGALAAIEGELALWEGRAAEAGFIAGPMLTLADCAFYPTLAYMQRRGLRLAGRPHLLAYVQRMQARPAAVASHPEGWELDRTGKPDLFALARAAVAAGRATSPRGPVDPA